jgi:CheY-like chemotaxis protein
MHEQIFSKVSALVVDDHVHTRKLLRAVLRAIGLRKIEEAGDGAEALISLRAGNFDLVFTDVRMPMVDGLEFIRAIRNDPGSPNPFVPIIVVSGLSSRTVIAECRNAGANEFVAKPFTSDVLIKRIVAAIDNPRPFIRSKQFFGPDRRRRKVEGISDERRTS